MGAALPVACAAPSPTTPPAGPAASFEAPPCDPADQLCPYYGAWPLDGPAYDEDPGGLHRLEAIAGAYTVDWPVPGGWHFVAHQRPHDQLVLAGADDIVRTVAIASVQAPVEVWGLDYGLTHCGVQDLVVLGDGRAALSCALPSVVVAFDPETGAASVVLGTGDHGTGALPGTPGATAIDVPTGLTVDAEDRLYVADAANHRILRVDGDSVELVAGGTRGFGGDGGPAVEASFDLEWNTDGVPLFAAGTITVAGNLLILADTGNRRIRQVDLESGLVWTVAGRGEQDDDESLRLWAGEALKVDLGVLTDLTWVPELGLVFAAAGSGCVRLLGDGVVSVLLGVCGETGPTVPYSPLEDVRLSDPMRLAPGPGGTFYLATGNDRYGGDLVYYVDPGALLLP